MRTSSSESGSSAGADLDKVRHPRYLPACMHLERQRQSHDRPEASRRRRSAAVFLGAFLLSGGFQLLLPLQSYVHDDTYTFLLAADECLQGVGCHFGGPPSGDFGIHIGGLWTHAMVLLQSLSLDASQVQLFVILLNAVGAALFLLALRQQLPDRGRWPALLSFLVLSLLSTGYPTLWNGLDLHAGHGTPGLVLHETAGPWAAPGRRRCLRLPGVAVREQPGQRRLPSCPSCWSWSSAPVVRGSRWVSSARSARSKCCSRGSHGSPIWTAPPSRCSSSSPSCLSSGRASWGPCCGEEGLSPTEGSTGSGCSFPCRCSPRASWFSSKESGASCRIWAP